MPLTADDVTNLADLPAIPLPLQLTDIFALYRSGLIAPAYQGPLSALVALILSSLVTQTMVASETVAVGALVNVWSNAGVPNARNASGAVHGKPAHGFAVNSVLVGGTLTVSFLGIVPATYGGLIPGPVYLSNTPGQGQSAPLTGVGTQESQQVGVCCDQTGESFVFQPQVAFPL